MGEAKQIEAEREGYGTPQQWAEDCLATVDLPECTPDHPCIDCQWANKREAEREQ